MSGDDLAIFLFWLTLAAAFGLEAVKAETTIRRAGFGTLATFFLVTGLFWLQIKTLWPQFTRWAASIATNPISWFVLFIFIAAIVAFHRPKLKSANTNEKRPQATPESLTAPVPEPPRVWLDIKPSYLMGLYENTTEIIGDALAAAYIGKWITVTGTVQDVSRISDKSLIVTISDEEGKYLTAVFPDDEDVSKLRHMATVTIYGQIRDVSSLRVALVKPEFTFPPV
jgi:hypothetical protein